ncbi:MAG: RNA-directed DNA polymerase, partial [bacterium]|nr:RNA-directed DNA polymerase [bacterium]
GNLTSQFWANVYLDPLDHFLKDELGAPGYIRYVDDFLVFGDDKERLAGWLVDARRMLEGSRLLLNERKTRIYPVEESIPFLGFRVFATHRRLLRAGVRRARRRLKKMEEACELGELAVRDVKESVTAWIAHASYGNTYGLRRQLLGGVAFRAGGQTCDPGRRVEQQTAQRRLRHILETQPLGRAGRKAARSRTAAVRQRDVQTAGPAPGRLRTGQR